MEIDPPMKRIGTIISVHAFEECDGEGGLFYIFSGSLQGPFHGRQNSTEGSLIHPHHGAGIQRSPFDGTFRLNGAGAWKPAKHSELPLSPYWTDMSVATFKCQNAFNLNPGWANRIGCDRVGYHQFKGEISELLVFDRVLLDAEIEHVEDYLLQKWFPTRQKPLRVPAPAEPSKTGLLQRARAAITAARRLLK